MPKPKKTAGPKRPAAKPTGRPPKSAGQVRGNALRIRLTDAERQELDRAAGDETLETSSWARAVLLREARRLRPGGDK